MTQPDEPGWVGSARRQAALSGPLRELHRAVLRRFLHTGNPPATGWIAGAAARLGLTDAAVAELEAADLIHATNGLVSGGGPRPRPSSSSGASATAAPAASPGR